MSLPVATALAHLLATEPEFVAEIRTLGLGSHLDKLVPQVILGNRRFEQLPSSDMPAWVLDAGDADAADAAGGFGDPAGMVIGTSQQSWNVDIELALVWHQQDYDAAVRQRLGLLPALVRLLLRNPDLGGTCGLAMVTRAINDRAGRHPTHAAAFAITASTTIYRDAP